MFEVNSIIKGMYCNESAIINCALAYDASEYPLAFRRAWNFNLKTDDIKISFGEKIGHGRDIYYIEKEIHNICGIELYRGEEIDRYSIISQLTNWLISNPVLLVIDLFWCKWTRYFEKKHGKHVITVVSQSEDGKGFWCLDTNFSNKMELLDNESLYKSYINYSRVFRDSKSINLDISSYLLDSIDYLKMQDFTCNILSCSDHIMNEFHYMDEFNVIDAFDVPIIYNIYLIKGGRHAYKQFLKYLYIIGKEKCVGEALDLLSNSIDLWEIVMCVLEKCFLKNESPNMKYISQKLYDIYLYENKAYNYLANLI